eukprot:758601-Hanusia_phi.AAC.1
MHDSGVGLRDVGTGSAAGAFTRQARPPGFGEHCSLRSGPGRPAFQGRRVPPPSRSPAAYPDHPGPPPLPIGFGLPFIFTTPGTTPHQPSPQTEITHPSSSAALAPYSLTPG